MRKTKRPEQPQTLMAHRNNSASDEMAAALAGLRIAYGFIDAKQRLHEDEAVDLLQILDDVAIRLRPIAAYLQAIGEQRGTTVLFRSCRERLLLQACERISGHATA